MFNDNRLLVNVSRDFIAASALYLEGWVKTISKLKDVVLKTKITHLIFTANGGNELICCSSSRLFGDSMFHGRFAFRQVSVGSCNDPIPLGKTRGDCR